MKRKRFRAIDFQEMAPCKQREFEIKNKTKQLKATKMGRDSVAGRWNKKKKTRGGVLARRQAIIKHQTRDFQQVERKKQIEKQKP